MKELKPCPYCGGKGSLQKYRFIGCADTYGVVCSDCKAELKQSYKTEKKAIEEWNHRPEKNQMTWSEVERNANDQQR